MVSLLNRLTWVVAILVSIIPIYIEWDTWMLSLFLLFIIKGLMFSRSSIETAVMEFSQIPQATQSNKVPTQDYKKNPIVENIPMSLDEWDSEIRMDIGQDTSSSDQVVTDIYWEEKDTWNDASKENIPIVPDEPSALWLWVHNFFSDRPLAKVWGILLFLWALFFLWLIFDVVGPFGKVLIGLVFWFSLIAVGLLLEKKEIHTESRVLFGIGIAVNYLTILSGRHLLANSIGSDPLFSDTFATIALLMNTWLAIVLSLVYRSRVLLGFAFIFAYATPFLVGSKESSVFLLSIYTTILTISIGIINSFYARLNETESIEYLQGIWIVGMTILFSLASIEVKTLELLAVFVWLFVSVMMLSIFSYRAEKSPLPIFAGAYIVLLISSIFWTTFLLLPFGIISLLLLSLFFVFQNILNIYFLTIFWWASFLLWIFWFWSGGSDGLNILFLLWTSIFCILWFAIIRTSSLLLATVAIGGFGILNFLGISTVDSGVSMNIESIMLMKWVSIILLIGASIFAFRLRDAFIFFLAIIMSGILLVYPNTFSEYSYITISSFLLFWILSLLVPYILTRDNTALSQKSFLLASLPLSALVVSYAIYQIWQDMFPWIWMGVAYIFQAILYLLYAFITGSRFFPHTSSDSLESSHEDGKNILLILFTLPLSLFTFSLAFLFEDIPGMMSLAWIIESTILYLVYTRMRIVHIFTFATIVFLVGIMKETTLLSSIAKEDWQSFSILLVMFVSVFSSLFILKNEEGKDRVSYDILHIISILLIVYGMSRIILSTGSGWSIFGPALLLLVITPLYKIFWKTIHQFFLSILLWWLCLVFIGKFDSLNKEEILPLFIQLWALGMILIIGYISYRSKNQFGAINLAISLIGWLYISSSYINFFFATFTVSIYLTVIASILIIRGIVYKSMTLRTLWLYIGMVALSKILGYDIWQWNNGMITRVVALMVAGWLMIYLSQLYGKYVSRSWKDELALKNIVGESSVPMRDVPEKNENPFIWDLGSELKNISVSAFSAVRFIPYSWDTFILKRVSVMRLAKHITDTLGKTQFSSNELSSAYDYVLQNLRSTLSKEELDSLLGKLRKWIEVGGNIEFVNK